MTPWVHNNGNFLESCGWNSHVNGFCVFRVKIREVGDFVCLPHSVTINFEIDVTSIQNPFLECCATGFILNWVCMMMNFLSRCFSGMEKWWGDWGKCLIWRWMEKFEKISSCWVIQFTSFADVVRLLSSKLGITFPEEEEETGEGGSTPSCFRH